MPERMRLGQVEDQAKRVVYRSELVERKVSHMIAQPSGIDRPDHLAQYPRGLATQGYLGMKGGGRS